MLAAFPIHWLALRLNHKGFLPALSWQQLERLGDALVLPTVVLLAGAYIAPRYKARTAVVLAILVLFAAICGLVIVADSSRMSLQGPLWQNILAVFLWAVSFSYGVYATRHADEW